MRQLANDWQHVRGFLDQCSQQEYAVENVSHALSILSAPPAQKDGPPTANKVYWQILAIVDVGLPLCRGQLCI